MHWLFPTRKRTGRIYADFAARLHDTYTATAEIFKDMEAEEDSHRRRLIEEFRRRFGEHIPLIRRKNFGAEVTGVCSTRNVELVQSLGADHVIDYTKEDFTKGDQKYDVILDNVANHSLSECRGVLTPNGFYVLIGGRRSERTRFGRRSW